MPATLHASLLGRLDRLGPAAKNVAQVGAALLRGPRRALHRRIAEALEQRFPDLVETRPEILAHHYSEAAMAERAVRYWHLAGKWSVAKSAVREAIAQLRRGLSLLEALPEARERDQQELDIHVTLTAALIGGREHLRTSASAVAMATQRSSRRRLTCWCWPPRR